MSAMIAGPIKSIKSHPLYGNNVEEAEDPTLPHAISTCSTGHRPRSDNLATENHERWRERWKEGTMNVFIYTSVYGHMKENMIF